MNKHFSIGISLVMLAAVFTGCSKDPLSNLTQEESRIYITNHDSSVNFKTYSTFAISDSVTVINNSDISREQTAVDIAYINAFRTQLEARGYTRVARTANPDLAVNVSRVYNTSTGIISYDNYWNGYGSYYDPFAYGFGGLGYFSPYSFATYSIREGALSIDILDLKNAAASNRINGIWSGLIRGSGIFNSATAATQVNMLFLQSPYLKKSN